MTTRATAAAAILAALLAGVSLHPAAAQEPSAAPIPQGGGTVDTGAGTPLEAPGAGTLPGVGLDSTPETEQNATSGPGGLQNGVGAEGVLTPDSSGSSGTQGQVPGAPVDPGQNTGIPIGPSN